MSIFKRDPHIPTATLAAQVSGGVTLRKESGPATNRDAVASAGPDLVKKFDKAGVSLSKRGLDGIRAQAVMLLDHSGSMDADYRNGNVQLLVERALGFALQIDADGTVPIVRFDSRIHRAVNVGMGNYQSAGQTLYEPRKMGSTNLTDALHQLHHYADESSDPIFAIIITDGQPNDPTSAETVVTSLAKRPVFLKFLSLQPVSWLDKLDDMGGRLIDNADAKSIRNPADITDLAFADAMTDEWDTWITAAQAVGLLA